MAGFCTTERLTSDVLGANGQYLIFPFDLLLALFGASGLCGPRSQPYGECGD